jgi:hypothetical protein
MVEQVMPQWEINQIFQATATAATRTMRALVMGPAYKVQRDVALSPYAAADITVGWPNRLAGDVVDQAFTEVTFKDAAQRYVDLATSNSVQLVSGKTNYLRKSTGTLNWRDNPTDPATYPRSAVVPVDVAIGDWIRVTNGGHVQISEVIGLTGAAISSSVGASAANAANIATQVASANVVNGTHTGDASAAASGTLYHGEAVRVMTEVYTLTVTAGDAAGAQATGTVTSASGTDPAVDINLSVATLALGSRGATITFSGGTSNNRFRAGDVYTVTVVQGYTAAVLTSGGSYAAGTVDTTYVITATKGGDLSASTAADKPEFSVTTVDASDAGAPRRVALSVAFPLGTKGITGTVSSAGGNKLVVYGDQWTVAATASKIGNYTDIIIADSLNATNFPGSTSFEIELGLVSDIAVPQNRAGAAPLVNWSTTTTGITLKAGVTSTQTRTGTLELTVQTASATVTTRALQTAMANVVVDVSDEASVQALLGADDVDAVLAYGVRRAISNAGGMTIKVLPVATDDLAGYQAAVAVLKDRGDFYRIVPLTYDASIQQAVISEVNRRSGSLQGRWATTMLGKPLFSETAVIAASVQGSQHLATITDPAAGSSYKTVTDASAKFITWGVRAGDTLRYAYTSDGFGNTTYSEGVVDSVLSEQRVLLLESLALPVSVASLYEIWHPMSTTERATNWGASVGALANRRVTVAFPANPGRGGVKVPSYFLACSLAALRCASAPQQGLTNANVLDWDDMSEAAVEFADQLDTLANYGAYIVTQSPTGTVYIRKQLTTDLSDVRKSEDSATVNFDSISYFFLDILAPYIGKANVVESAISLMEATINNGIQTLGTSDGNAMIGPQLANGQLQYIRPHAVLLDRVVARITGALPIPLNNGELDIVV